MKRRSKSSLFLIEFIIVILFFSLASTVCVQLFVKSHLLDRKTKSMNLGIRICQNYSEIFSGFDGDREAFLNYLKDEISDRDGSGYVIPYSESGTVLHPDDDTSTASYYCTLAFRTEDRMTTLDIRFQDASDTSEIYSLQVRKYTGGAVHE